MMLLLAGDMLRRTARRLPRKSAIICGPVRVSYAELDALADRFAAALAARGIGAGEVVAIMSPNCPDYAVAFYGAARAGAILANVNARGTASDLAGVLAATAARLLVIAPELLPLAAAARSGAPGLAHVVACGTQTGSGAESFATLLAGASPHAPELALGESAPLGLTFTGGTTGEPKGVLVSHRARGISALTALVEFGLGEDDVVAVTTPLFHVMGLFIWFHAAVACGATSILAPRWRARDFIADVARYGVTAALLVPTQIGDLVGQQGLDPAALRSLRRLNHAGMPMPAALADRVRSLLPAVELVENYGTSETGPLTARRHRQHPTKSLSVGRPVLSVELEIRAPDGRRCAAGEIGEVVTRGDHLMLGYYRDAPATAAAFKSGDGWFWTGDLGYLDPDGFLFIVDRSKDVINQGGENIFPSEIEQALYSHPAVQECVVVGAPDDRLGEVPAAQIVLRPGTRVTAEELIEFCLGRLARYKRPRRISFVDALPKSAVGKVHKQRIRAFYRPGGAAEP